MSPATTIEGVQAQGGQWPLIQAGPSPWTTITSQTITSDFTLYVPFAPTATFAVTVRASAILQAVAGDPASIYPYSFFSKASQASGPSPTVFSPTDSITVSRNDVLFVPFVHVLPTEADVRDLSGRMTSFLLSSAAIIVSSTLPPSSTPSATASRTASSTSTVTAFTATTSSANPTVGVTGGSDLSLSGGSIAGIAIGAAAVLGIILGLAIFFALRQTRSRARAYDLRAASVGLNTMGPHDEKEDNPTHWKGKPLPYYESIPENDESMPAGAQMMPKQQRAELPSSSMQHELSTTREPAELK